MTLHWEYKFTPSSYPRTLRPIRPRATAIPAARECRSRGNINIGLRANTLKAAAIAATAFTSVSIESSPFFSCPNLTHQGAGGVTGDGIKL